MNFSYIKIQLVVLNDILPYKMVAVLIFTQQLPFLEADHMPKPV